MIFFGSGSKLNVSAVEPILRFHKGYHLLLVKFCGIVHTEIAYACTSILAPHLHIPHS